MIKAVSKKKRGWGQNNGLEPECATSGLVPSDVSCIRPLPGAV